MLTSLISLQLFVTLPIVGTVITPSSYNLKYIKREVFKVAISILCLYPAPSLQLNYPACIGFTYQKD